MSVRFLLLLLTAAPVLAGEPFRPPPESAIPDGPFGERVRAGRELFTATEGIRERFGGNGTRCIHCHLDRGRKPDAAPVWAAWGRYPLYHAGGRVETLHGRIAACWRDALGARSPTPDGPELTALTAYLQWLATGAPAGTELPGRGFPPVGEPPLSPDAERGAAVYREQCAVCHGESGEGRRDAAGHWAFPPLWGADAYSFGSEMHRVDTAAAFIQANMPLGRGHSLSDQQAWDVAWYINGRPRPPDPRFSGHPAEVRASLHDHACRYGEEVEGRVLGAGPALPVEVADGG